MVAHIVGVAQRLRPDKVLVVVGHQKERVKRELATNNVEFVEQTVPLGTGDAVRRTEKILKGFKGDLLILCGDTPLLRPETLQNLVALHRKEAPAATILTAFLKDPTGYGRIKRNGSGEVLAIVEEADATPEERLIKEVNSGVYLFSAPQLFSVLAEIKPDNAKGEYYLTDAIHILRKRGQRVVAWATGEPKEILGVNSPEELEIAQKILAKRRGGKE